MLKNFWVLCIIENAVNSWEVTHMKRLLQTALICAIALLACATTAHAKLPKDVDCLAKNIYYEARGEPVSGQIAVALVTINRVESTRYADTICGVVYQKGQFSWTKSPTKRVSEESWREAVEIAKRALSGAYDNLMPNFEALYFHSARLRNMGCYHKKHRPQLVKIGNHVFC